MTKMPKRYKEEDIPDKLIDADSVSPEYIIGNLSAPFHPHKVGDIVLILPSNTVFIFDKE